MVTAAGTAPLESSVRVWPPVSSATLLRTIFLNVARVPEEAGRRITTIGISGPPTAFQFVVLPVQMSAAWAVVRFVTPVTPLLVTMIQPCLATMWSTRASASGVASFEAARTSLAPIWTAP